MSSENTRLANGEPRQEKINILMFNMSSYVEWEMQGVQNRNWHVLRNLQLHENVGKIVAVDFMPHSFRRTARNYLENIIRQTDHKVIFKTLFSRALEINDKLSVYSSIYPQFFKKTYQAEIKELLKKLEIDDYVIWSCYPLEVSYFKDFKPLASLRGRSGKLKIFDMVDNWSEHPSYEKIKEKIVNNYKLIDKEADVIFTVAEELQNFYDHKEKVHWIPNGVDLKHYQKEYPIINRDIGEIIKPIIGYVGTIQDRLDQDLLEYLVKNNPQKSFVMVGPVWYKEIERRFTKYDNVYFLGRKKYEDVPMYIQQFDVGIIPHKIDEFIKSTNPMKIYEYLACGKPVVSTKGSGIEKFKDVAYITDDFKEFDDYLNQSLLNTNTKQKKQRLDIIKEHSWLKRVDAMLELINNL